MNSLLKSKSTAELCSNPSIRKSISLTHVQYQSGDVLGKILACISLTPITLIVSYITLIIFKRDIVTLYLFIGQLGNEIVNKCLKEWIQEKRPSDHLGDGSYGMPSSHSQFMWFFTTFCILHLYTHVSFRYKLMKPFISCGLVVMALLVGVSRVYLEYHTIEQVVVGSCLGLIIGLTWFLLSGNLNWISRLLIHGYFGELLLFKDTREINNVLHDEFIHFKLNRKNKMD
ncbi:PAP2 superfamily-domain-containing protein [Globomyces pollinis-pini]|nr:PAP2 superfamily-domain-containing protein [Globomyces pollinis-pini]